MAVTARRIRLSQFAAACPSGALIGDCVYISASAISGVYQVGLCNIEESNKRAAGLIIAKQSSTRCTIQTDGEVAGIYSGLTPGRHVFLKAGAGGRLTQVLPSKPSSGVRYIENAGFALSDDVIFLNFAIPKVRIA